MYAINLCGSGGFSGRVVHGGIDCEYGPGVVLVLPHAGPEYYTTMVSTARKNGGRLAVVVEAGGAGAHLVVTASEKNGGGAGSIAIMMHPKARDILPEGAIVYIDATERTIYTD